MINVDSFNIKGTITSAKVSKLNKDIMSHIISIKNNDGKYEIIIFSSAKGYNKDLLSVGHTIRFRGVSHKENYCTNTNEEKVFTKYFALEMAF